MEPFYLQRLAKLVDDFQVARSRELGADDLAQIAEAATAGRVGTLLVEDEMKGEVVVVPAERMPSKTGAAASYRFQMS